MLIEGAIAGQCLFYHIFKDLCHMRGIEYVKYIHFII